jgi:hypothetical protein
VRKLLKDVTEMIRPFAASALLVSIATVAPAREQAPKVLVDEGACPFECCQYGRWTVTEDTPAFVSPETKHAALTIPAGTEVTALTGYVRTVGRPFIVARAHAPYQPGDRLMVYTYHGEGTFTVWHNGRRFTEDLGFSPYGGTGGKRCTDRKYCWGTLSQALESDWWVHVRLANGRTVWVRDAGGFEGQDACG